jgi:hypothetical protein
MNCLKWLFGRRAPRKQWLEIAAVCPRQFAASELHALLSGQKDNEQVQAILQLLTMTRALCLEAAQKEASRGGNQTHYHLGGVAAIEDTVAEILNTLNGAPASDDVKTYFAD